MNENFSEFTNTFVEIEKILPPKTKIQEIDSNDMLVVESLAALSPKKEYFIKKLTPVASLG
jgi:hypothetical protein